MKNLRQGLIRQKYWQVWNRTQSDPEYARMFAQMAELEQRFESVMEQLPDDTQDVIRDFVMHCEDMSRRMLECACEELLFAETFPLGTACVPSPVSLSDR